MLIDFRLFLNLNSMDMTCWPFSYIMVKSQNHDILAEIIWFWVVFCVKALTLIYVTCLLALGSYKKGIFFLITKWKINWFRKMEKIKNKTMGSRKMCFSLSCDLRGRVILVVRVMLVLKMMCYGTWCFSNLHKTCDHIFLLVPFGSLGLVLLDHRL